VTIPVDDGEFGSEEKKDWIVLSIVEPHGGDEYESNCYHHSPIPEPDAVWFAFITSRQFSSKHREGTDMVVSRRR
jgi:hypothetical protein